MKNLMTKLSLLVCVATLGVTMVRAQNGASPPAQGSDAGDGLDL